MNNLLAFDWDMHWVLHFLINWIRHFFVDWIWNFVWDFHWNFDFLILVDWDWIINFYMHWVLHFLVNWVWDFLLVIDWIRFVNMDGNRTIHLNVNWVMFNFFNWIRLVDMHNFLNWVMDSFFDWIWLRDFFVDGVFDFLHDWIRFWDFHFIWNRLFHFNVNRHVNDFFDWIWFVYVDWNFDDLLDFIWDMFVDWIRLWYFNMIGNVHFLDLWNMNSLVFWDWNWNLLDNRQCLLLLDWMMWDGMRPSMVIAILVNSTFLVILVAIFCCSFCSLLFSFFNLLIIGSLLFTSVAKCHSDTEHDCNAQNSHFVTLAALDIPTQDFGHQITRLLFPKYIFSA